MVGITIFYVCSLIFLVLLAGYPLVENLRFVASMSELLEGFRKDFDNHYNLPNKPLGYWTLHSRVFFHYSTYQVSFPRLVLVGMGLLPSILTYNNALNLPLPHWLKVAGVTIAILFTPLQYVSWTMIWGSEDRKEIGINERTEDLILSIYPDISAYDLRTMDIQTERSLFSEQD